MAELKNFIAYKSSAGSGKTYTLVREFLRIVIESDNPTRYRNILAITFTNKAANEMKERVLSNLKELSEDIDSNLLVEFSKEFKIEKNVIREKSKKILQSVLHNYSDLKILTIDKFTHKIIRAFSKDLNLSNDFEIELDSDKILKEAIDLLVSKAGIEEYISKLLQEYLNKRIEEEENWKIEDSLFNFSRELLKEENTSYLNQLKAFEDDQFENSKKFILKKFKEKENKLIEIGKSAIELITRNGIDKGDFNREVVFNYFGKIWDKNFSSLLLPDGKILTDAIENNIWLKKTASSAAQSAIDSITDELRSYYYELKEEAKEYYLFKLLKENIYNLMLIKEIYLSLEQIKEDGNVLMIADFNKLISEEIKHQPAPFIYEKIGERYKNIMIDEFQDTSVMQWHNLLPLIDNSLSIGEKTLVVGDAKQAIYRFRGGKVEQFVKLPNLIDKSDDIMLEEREIALSHNYKEKELDTNYRSHNQVIEFNNWFFEGLKMFLDEEKQVIYKNQEQNNTGKDEGYVNLSFIEAEKEEKDEINFEVIKSKIDECLEDGFTQKDITILVDKNNQGTKISNYLLQNDYQVVTSESLLIAENKEVNAVYNFLKYIQNNKDNSSKLEIIKFFFEEEKFSPALFNFSEKTKNKADIKIEELTATLSPEFNMERLYELSLYDMTETIIREFIPKSNTTNSFLVKFLDIIHSYSTKINDLKSFIDYFENKKNKLSLETPDSDAITIMTVHKSKGLQFKVVISAFTNWKFYPTNNRPNVWVSLKEKFPEVPIGLLNLKKEIEVTEFAFLKEQDEQQVKLDKFNMLYVALTRAEKRLYLLCDNKVSKKDGYYDNIINSYIYQVAKNHPDFKEEELIIGERKKHKAIIESQENTKKLKELVSTNWREKIRISKQYQDLWGEQNYKGKIAYGNLIHNILSNIESKKDTEEVILDFVEQGLIKKSEVEEFVNEINEIMSIHGVDKWFSEELESLNEKEIISADGKLYRPDKVIVMNGETHVVDFKTGEKQSSYSKQINNYGKLLEEMNYPVVKKFLLFTKEREIVEVD